MHGASSIVPGLLSSFPAFDFCNGVQAVYPQTRRLPLRAHSLIDYLAIYYGEIPTERYQPDFYKDRFSPYNGPSMEPLPCRRVINIPLTSFIRATG